MWVAFLVVLLNTGDVMVQSAPTPFATLDECKEISAKVEENVKASKEVNSYVLKCVEIKKEEIKKAGLDV
jgi:hypothetical protein